MRDGVTLATLAAPASLAVGRSGVRNEDYPHGWTQAIDLYMFVAPRPRPGPRGGSPTAKKRCDFLKRARLRHVRCGGAVAVSQASTGT